MKTKFFAKARKVLTPPAGLGAKDVRTQSSVCTGETLIGFQAPGSGKLLNAVVVRSPADIAEFYRSYGLEPPPAAR